MVLAIQILPRQHELGFAGAGRLGRLLGTGLGNA
jgi:hypothetical protein